MSFSAEFLWMRIHQRSGPVKCMWPQVYKKELLSWTLEIVNGLSTTRAPENHSHCDGCVKQYLSADMFLVFQH